MKKIRIKQVKSSINRTANQKRNLEALGLKGINHVIEIDNKPELLGMVNKIKHLVEVEEI